MTSPRWARRPEGSNWGEFGPDDQAGRLNLIGPEQVLKGIAEVREGRTFCLSLPLDLPGGNKLNPRRHPPRLFATERLGEANYNFPLAREAAQFTDVISDDAVLLHTQYSTQWDALSHVGGRFDADGDGEAEAVYYNGWRAGQDVVPPPDPTAAPFEGPCARRLGIQVMAERGVQGRAVLVDLHAHFGDARTLVGYDELMRVMAADKVTVEPGDMVCLHTGFTRIVREMGGQPDAERLHGAAAALNGRDPRLQDWIRDSGLAVLIADNYAVEAYPAAEGHGDCAALPLHELCLFKLGIHLGELWWLHDLAGHLRAQGRSRFLLTAPPLNLPGAVGSPATPIATV
ncbi:Putative cyclase [Tistlia consotensis]|uniref:Putative cyclase n=1 Tax=Tistlia consotensis USBA 355 TaxID=560819 RepID=A0A1Y6BV28_9PROT|nr:cyclase family protein [Tistlia consotensis]SMF30223.1 Putative cyclase [Tistlia consotensis USBA 355]SNR90260.1 Putative cyclase [Tistlia consotensis]